MLNSRTTAHAAQLALAASLLALPAAAQSSWLDFELGAPCSISQAVAASTEYISEGVTFIGPATGGGPVIVEDCGTLGLGAFEGRGLLVVAPGVASASGPADGPIRMAFTPPIHRVRLRAATQFGGGTYQLTAYRAGVVVASRWGGSLGWMEFSWNVPGGMDELVVERTQPGQLWGIDGISITRRLPSIGRRLCEVGVQYATCPSSLSAFGTTTGGGPYSDLVFELTGAAPNGLGLLLASREGNYVLIPGGTPYHGQLCLSVAPLLRIPSGLFLADAGGNATAFVDLTALSVQPPVAVLAGETWYFQGWHRLEGTWLSGMSNSLQIQFQ